MEPPFPASAPRLLVVTAAVLFDVDGTLLDHDSAARAAITSWVTRHHARHAGRVDEVAAVWLRLEQEHFAAYLSGAATFEQQRRRRLAGLLSYLGEHPGDDATVEASFSEYLDAYEAAWSAYDDVAPTLNRLAAAGIVLAILTNGDAEQQRRKLASVGLVHLFEHILVSSELPAPKPAPEAFLEAVSRMTRHPSEVLYVGDNLDDDALAAARTGLRGVWLQRSGNKTAPDQVEAISTLTELPHLLASTGRFARPAGGH